jgi:hypothetical protein
MALALDVLTVPEVLGRRGLYRMSIIQRDQMR